MQRGKIIITVVIAVLAGAFFLARQPDDGNPSTPSATSPPTISSAAKGRGETPIVAETSRRPILVSNGVTHSVPLEEIIAGGPARDGIPSIDRPKFTSINKTSEWLSDDEPGIAVSYGKTHRFYPYQILVWHEMVNDTIEGKRVLVTYCPLCLTGFVFDPVVSGERVEFGTSGKLWKSNLVMYDRKTESLWSQVLGEAIAGPMTGAALPLIPSDQMRYGVWKRQFPKGEVLSRDTGVQRFYGENPYGDYFTPTRLALSLAGPIDHRLPPETIIFGIVRNGTPKAWSIEEVKKRGVVEDIFEGMTFVFRYDPEHTVVRMFERKKDIEVPINPVSGFWFSWAAIHPDTLVFPAP